MNRGTPALTLARNKLGLRPLVQIHVQKRKYWGLFSPSSYGLQFFRSLSDVACLLSQWSFKVF